MNERERLIASHQAASDAFDRSLMTLSGGSLGLSIAFVNDIASNPSSTWALKTSWVLMASALAMILASFVASVEVHRRLIAGLDTGRSYDAEPPWVRWSVTWLNVCAGMVFVLGAAFLVYFAFVNI